MSSNERAEQPGLPDYLRSAYASIMNGTDEFFVGVGNTMRGISRENSLADDFGTLLIERAAERRALNTPYILSSTEGQRLAGSALYAASAAASGATLALATRGRSIPAYVGGAAAGVATQQAVEATNDAASFSRVVGDAQEEVAGDIARVSERMRSRLSPYSASSFLETLFSASPAAFTSGRYFGGFQPAALASDVVQAVASSSQDYNIRKMQYRGTGSPVSLPGQLQQTAGGAAGWASSKIDIPGTANSRYSAVADAALAFVGEAAANTATDMVGTRASAQAVLTHMDNLKALAAQNERRRQAAPRSPESRAGDAIVDAVERLLGRLSATP